MDVKAKVRLNEKAESLKGFADVVLNDEFVVTNVRIYEGEKGLFVSMPSYKRNDKYTEVCFPITKEFREQINSAIFAEYEKELKQAKEQKHDEKQDTKKGKVKKEQKSGENSEPEQTEDVPSQSEEAEETFEMTM
ncbi:MAG: SpoVG family protein [Clostridia bacterium]|nr:SpoVG family protein [Clostridia bacterium]